MSQTEQITKIRAKLDKVDTQLLDLLGQRAQLALDMKQAKGSAPIYSPAREAEIIRRLTGSNSSHFPNESIRAIFSEIIGASRNLERQLKVAYLGPEGTYSHEAAEAMLGSTSMFLPLLTLPEVLKSAETGESDIAFLPFENSSEGAVIETHRLLTRTTLEISGEFTLPIRHCLLTKSAKLSEIKTIYAHSQAIGQCREWLQLNLPNAKLVSESSNSQAAKLAATAPYSAAIASQKAAEFTGLPILVNGINDFADNQTRFIALSTYKTLPTGNDKTSIICTVGDKVGALYELLGIFAKHKLSLTRLESQPQPDHVYAFYIDFEGHQDEPDTAKALQELKHEAKTCKVLGSYPKAG